MLLSNWCWGISCEISRGDQRVVTTAAVRDAKYKSLSAVVTNVQRAIPLVSHRNNWLDGTQMYIYFEFTALAWVGMKWRMNDRTRSLFLCAHTDYINRVKQFNLKNLHFRAHTSHTGTQLPRSRCWGNGVVAMTCQLINDMRCDRKRLWNIRRRHQKYSSLNCGHKNGLRRHNWNVKRQ